FEAGHLFLPRGLRLRRRRRLLRLHALADHHERAVGAGHRAADEHEVLLGEHADDADVEHGAAIAAHASRQLVTRPHARRIRRGADGTGGAMEHRAVARLAAFPVVALHAALEALALGHAHDVHDLAGREDVGADALPDRV